MTSDRQSKLEKFPKLLARFFDTQRQMPVPGSAACWLPLLLGGYLLIAAQAIADAKPLPAPRIFNDSQQRQPNFPPASVPRRLPSLPPDEVPNNRELEFEASPSPTRSNPRFNSFRVEIDGDSPLLLTQVQRIVPDAFVRSRGVIQAGAFGDRSFALERVRVLEAQGIRAQIKMVSATDSDFPRQQSAPIQNSVPRQDSDGRGNSGAIVPDSGSVPRQESDSQIQGRNSRQESDFLRSANYYFVVVPGRRSNLADMAAEVIRLGVDREAVRLKEGPRGSHVAVGPFDDRRQAERWSSYLRSVGMDARVYFGR